MESIWTLAKVDELEFAAASALLAIKAKKRSLPVAEQADDTSSDDSEPEEDENEDCATSKPTARIARHSHGALVNKFLDRLGEVLAREKSSPKCRVREDSKHVAATAWIGAEAGSPLTVIVAKNEGLDDQDLRMLAKLQQWLRLVSIAGQKNRSVHTDKIWTDDDDGLVAYSRSRLVYHISQVVGLDNQKVTSLAALSNIAAQVDHLLRLCRAVEFDATVQQLSTIVDLAYKLRSAWKDLPVQPGHIKAIRSINMLGRLRAAYECFKSIALSFETVSKLEMKPVTFHRAVEINTSLFSRSLKRLGGELQLPRGVLEGKSARKYTTASRLHIHAEMQILASLGESSNWHQRAHPYIGVSRKLCFLCSQILEKYITISLRGARQPNFRARQSHGKIYPLWTIPDGKNMDRKAKFYFATATSSTHVQMLQMLRQGPLTRPPVAESSAGVTVADPTSAAKEQYLATLPISKSPEAVFASEAPIKLGRKVKTIHVALLPADGSRPKLIPIDFHTFPVKEQARLREYAPNLVPDFHRYWRTHQFDCQFQEWTLKGQASEDCNGKYRIYWNETPELLENETVKTLLDIENISATRRFWYGDVFLVRFSEHPTTSAFDVHDVPASILQCEALAATFRNLWERKFLEAELERDRSFGEHAEKFEADKEIIRQRMSVTLDKSKSFNGELNMLILFNLGLQWNGIS